LHTCADIFPGKPAPVRDRSQQLAQGSRTICGRSLGGPRAN
jgi:hypothetical protein